MLDLLARHSEFFVVRRLDRLDISILVGFLLLVVPLPWIVLEILLGKASDRAGRALHVAVVGGYSLLAGLLLLRRLDFRSATPAWAMAMIGSVVFVTLYRRAPWLRSFVGLSAVGLLVVPIAFFFNPQVSRLMTIRAPSMLELPRLDCEAPIVFMVFDELNTLVLLDAEGRINRNRYPHLARLADRSTWYRNTVTVAESTEHALPAILTGRRPEPESKPRLADHPGNLFTLFGGTYTIWADEAFTALCPAELNRFEGVAANPARKATVLALDLTVVFLHLVLPSSTVERLPPISATWAGFVDGGDLAEPGPGQQAKPSFFKQALDALKQDRRVNFERFIGAMESMSDRELFFAHMLLPHRPWELLPDGTTYPSGRPSIPGLVDKTWVDNPVLVQQAFQRFMLQTMYVDTEIGRLTDRLHERGLFDEALIVLVADHGVSFSRGATMRWISEKNAHEILQVPLLIKAPHQVDGRVIASRISTVDILPTVLDLLGVQPPWAMDGRSRALGPIDPMEDPVVLTKNHGFVVVDWDLEAHLRRAVRRKIALFGDGADPEDLYRYGPCPELVGRVTDEIPRLDDLPWTATVDDVDAYSKVAPQGDSVPSFVRGSLKHAGRPTVAHDVAIVVNGRVAATTTTYELGPRPQRFGAMIPSASLRPGFNELEIFKIVKRPQGAALRRIAVR